MALNTRPTRLNYCQYLVSSQINYTLTNFADHSLKFSHDQLNRCLRDDKLTPRLVWEQTREQIITSPNGYLIFDERGGRQELFSVYRVGAPAVERQHAFGHSGYRHGYMYLRQP